MISTGGGGGEALGAPLPIILTRKGIACQDVVTLPNKF
jgi:hypothetical protein